MLLSNVIFLIDVTLESSENISLLHEVFTALALDLEQGLVCNSVFVRRRLAVFGWYREIFEFFSEDNDGLLRKKGILRGLRSKIGRRCTIEKMLLSGKEPGSGVRAVECI
jgi:hypothetical protein